MLGQILSGKKTLLPKYSWQRRMEPLGVRPSGLVSGHLAAPNDGKVWAEHKPEFFVAATFENLAGDMARGQGEHLTTLAILLGVPTGHQQIFFTLAQEHYRELIGSGEASPSALLKALDRAMTEHPVLAKVDAAR